MENDPLDETAMNLLLLDSQVEPATAYVASLIDAGDGAAEVATGDGEVSGDRAAHVTRVCPTIGVFVAMVVLLLWWWLSG